MTKTKELELVTLHGAVRIINARVPDDFATQTEEGQLKWLFTLRYMVDVNKNTIYNTDALLSIKILES